MILLMISDKAFDKTIDKTSGFINGGCLALGVIQSTHQFPDFILKATELFSLRLPSRIIPHHEHEGPHHQGTHPRSLIIVWPILYFVQICGSSYSNRFILLQEVYTLPTRYAHPCLART